MKKTGLIHLILMLMIFTTVPAAEAFTIKLGVVTKPGAAQNIMAEKFKELVEARSNGAYTVKIYHSASIGNETEILQQIQMGTIHMGVITGGPFDTFDPVVRVINYPFLFKDHDQADRILDGPLGDEILKSLETSGFKGLCFSENGFRNLTNSKREKNADRLALLREKGMQVVDNPDIDAFRERVAGLKDLDLYRDPRVRDLLVRMLAAVE